MTKQSKEKGVTLVELLIALVIGAIILGFAIPAFNSMVISNRIVSETNTFLSALSFARSEAVKRNRSVDLAARDGDWSEGYLVQLTADDTLIREYPALSGGATLTTASETSFTFNGRGVVTTATDVVALCNGADHEGRAISISQTGITNVTKKTDCP